MKKIRIAIIGLGRLGRKCVEAIVSDQSTELAGVVRRPESAPAPWLKAPAVTHISELNQVDAALICVPVDTVMGIAQGLLQGRIPLVECARLHGDAFFGHKMEIRRAALRHKVPAIVGAGCDPGALSLFRSQFALLAPRGHTETSLHTGTSLQPHPRRGRHPGRQESAGNRMHIRGRRPPALRLCRTGTLGRRGRGGGRHRQRPPLSR